MIQHPLFKQIDFTQSLLVTGEQRCGKSQLAKTIIQAWADVPNAELLLVGESFASFGYLPNLHRFKVLSHYLDAMGALSEARSYIYKRQHGAPLLPRLVVAIDDFWTYYLKMPHGKLPSLPSPRLDFVTAAKDVIVLGAAVNVTLLLVAQSNTLKLECDVKQHLTVTKPDPQWNNIPYSLTTRHDTYEFMTA